MKKTSVLLTLAILLSLFSACTNRSGSNLPNIENLTDLVPSTTNLIVSGNPSEIVTDPDIKDLSRSLVRILGSVVDFDIMVPEVKEALGIDMTVISDILLFMDITQIHQQILYYGIMCKGTFKQEEILSAAERSSGQQFISTIYNGHTIYDIGYGRRIVFLGNNVMVMGTMNQVIKDVIDTSKGSKSHISGNILDSYHTMGETLIRGAVTPTAYFKQVAIQVLRDGPVDVSHILNTDLVILSIKKTGNLLITRLSIQYPTTEEATRAEAAIRESLGLIKGSMLLPRDEIWANLVDKLIKKVQINREALQVNLVFEVTTSEILDFINAIAVPILKSPAEGSILDNGRSDGKDNIIWDFDWYEVPSATQYQIYVISATSVTPVINAQISNSYYRWVNNGSIGGGNTDQDRFGWTWKVRALVNGLWSDWSQRTFDVEPVDTDPPMPTPIQRSTITPTSTPAPPTTTVPTPTPAPPTTTVPVQ